MEALQLVYSEGFMISLEQTIFQWENELGISQEKIQQFVTSIQRALDLATVFPQMYEEVSDIYHFNQPTYRIFIGKSYALFYRMSEAKKKKSMLDAYSKSSNSKQGFSTN